jgi:hypothetical protein
MGLVLRRKIRSVDAAGPRPGEHPAIARTRCVHIIGHAAPILPAHAPPRLPPSLSEAPRGSQPPARRCALLWIDNAYRMRVPANLGELSGADYGVRRFEGQALRLSQQPGRRPGREKLTRQRG